MENTQNVLSWKITFKGQDAKEINVTNKEKFEIEMLWDDFLQRRKDQRIQIGKASKLVSDIKSIDPLSYVSDGKIREPFYKWIFCNWCGASIPWNCELCECQKYERDKKNHEWQCEYEEWKIKHPEFAEKLDFDKWLQERTRRKLKMLLYSDNTSL